MLLGFITPFGVRAQPVIFVQPIGQEAGIGTDVTFRVGARNDTPLPLRYHWRLNGETLRGATNSTLTVSNVQPRNAGSYSVTVADPGGSVNSDIARLTLTLPVLPFSDDFNSKTNQIVALAGIGRGNNANASREKGEPFHAGNRGSHSVWLTWRPLADGIANFSTAGSGFDTLLAVYTGADLTNLTQVEANDDQGGFHTSSVQFNATAGTVYHVAVDGRGRAAGEIVLLWHMEVTRELLPNITVEPLNTIGLIGDKISLAVRLDTLTDTGVQWLFNGQEISAATSDVLDVGDLQRTKVGKYVARIRKGTHEILSEPVEIQIHVRGDGTIDRNVRAGDKFNDVADLIASSLQPQDIQPSRLQRAASAPARGYTGTQIFSTFGATKEEGEPNHCGEPGGASEWYAYQAEADGIITIDTDGSDFDTVLAVYTGPGTDFDSLVEVACDQDSGQDGKDSKATFAVKAGTVYFIAVDGVDGASGTVTLNYNLLVSPRISSIPDQTTDEGTPTGTINFTVDSANPQATNFTLTASSSNTNLVPSENIFFGASTTNHTIRIIPATNKFGTTTIIVIASDGTTSASESFVVTVEAVNDAPTISDLVSSISTPEGNSPNVPFTVNDVETPAANLTVSAVSSDTNVVSIVGIVIGNGGTNRVLMIQTPAPTCSGGGSATLTLTVTDSDGGTISRNLPVNVFALGRPATITPILDHTIKENTSTAPLPFFVLGSLGQDTNLVLLATAWNTNLVPNKNILIAGSGTSRTVTITPAANQTGSTVITVTVVDECGSTANSSFTLTVNPTNTPPTISLLQSCVLVSLVGPASLQILFTVSDLETPADALVITANSSNTNLVLDTSIIFGGSGTNRTVTFTTTTNLVPFTRITITVTDTDGGTASASFLVTTGHGPPGPFISPIPDRAIIANTPPLTISLAVDDCGTPPGFLMVSGNSSNPALVPDANIVISGSGSNRIITITPATNQTGTTTLTMTVLDTDGNTASTSFVLTVLPEIRLNAQSILVGGAPQIRLTGFTGPGGLIQSSTDLKSWQSIYTNTAPDGQLPPLDFQTTAQPWQFFRALLSR